LSRIAFVSDDVIFAGAVRQAEMVRAGEISAAEIVQLHLERIGRIDPQLNSFRVVLGERALLEAEQADARLRSGDEGPLLGVPIALKDNHDLAGELTTHGTNGFSDPAEADCEMVRRLREAGAIVVGKVNMPELATLDPTESMTWGVSRNPWNLGRGPGGSSGGSSAAVAAGLVSLASASDGAGSIRVPAASCGVFGLKPQRGRIPLAPELEHWNGLTVSGAISRTVLDSALWLDVTAGNSAEPGAPPPPNRPFVESAKSTPGKLRIAYSTAIPPNVVAAPIVSDAAEGAVDDTAELLRSLGHETVPNDPVWGNVMENFTPRFLKGIAEDYARVPHPERLEQRTRELAEFGRALPQEQFEQALLARELDAARINAIFESHDALMTPVSASAAPLPIGSWDGHDALSALMGMAQHHGWYTSPWNHLGNPAMAVPAGFTDDGMPLSVQIIGRPGDESTLLSLAAQLEAERPWTNARPPL
jgi:amidase